jgi:prephenate dehydratase
MANLKASIQGYEGSFHAMAAKKYFEGTDIDLLPADTFEILAKKLKSNECDIAVMAIENSIAGSILQNYKILRENNFWISGEIYLQIEHCLMVNKGADPKLVSHIYSHPMAINQCLQFLHAHYPNAKLIESDDTALAAIDLAKNPQFTSACIASKQAGEINDLDILHVGIQNSKNNYTRFFILNKEQQPYDPEVVNKVSVYLQIPDKKGQLLKVLQCIENQNLNMSKLQSFPVLGKFREYFFHIDIEFDHIEQYLLLKEEVQKYALDFTEMGIYKRADDDIIKLSELQNINTTTL